MNKADRYQFQPRRVKAYRWLRYMPVTWALGCWRIGWWILKGAPDAGGGLRFWETVCMAWGCHIAMAQHKMGWWYTMDETWEAGG